MIDPSARIAADAQIDPDAEIGPFCVVEAGAVIGPGCKLYHSVFICRDTVLQEGCIVHPFCVVGHIPQDRSWLPENRSRTVIGAGSELREGVTVHRGTAPGSETKVGRGAYLMAYAHIGHNCTVGDRVTVANNTALGGYCQVGEGAFISGNVSVHQHCRIGALAMVSSSSFINRDLLPWATASGVPAGIVGVNTVGLQRSGYSADEIRRCKEAVKTVLNRANPFHVRQARLESAAAAGDSASRILLEFMAGTARGLLQRRH